MIRRALILIVVLGAAVVSTSAAADWAEVDAILHVYPVGEFTCVAAEFAVPVGTSVTGLRWYNNDTSLPFPTVILLEGAEGVGPDLADAGLLLAEVDGPSLAWGEVGLESPVSSSTGTIYAVFVLPAGEELTDKGDGGGPGIGVVQDPDAPLFYISAEGAEWTRFDPQFGLAAELVQGQLKGAAMELSSLKGALGDRWGKAASRPAPVQAGRTVFVGAAPNPFNPSVMLSFELGRRSKVSMRVFDVRGRHVATLVDGELEAGPYAYGWHGQDEQGRRVASGVYLVRFEGDGVRHLERVVLLK